MLVHFRDDSDMYRVGATEFLRRYSLDDDDFKRKIVSFPPVVAADLTFGMDTAISGELVMIMRRAQLLRPPARGPGLMAPAPPSRPAGPPGAPPRGRSTAALPVARGAWVLAAAERVNIQPEAVAEFEAHGVAVLKSGRARIPNYRSSADLGAEAPPPYAYACFTETYLFAREGIRTHSVGLPTPAQAEEVERIAARHGVRPRAP